MTRSRLISASFLITTVVLLASPACVKMDRALLPPSGSPQSSGGSCPALPSPPATATASRWLGTNGDADVYYVDITHQLNGFNTSAAQKDAHGYPIAGASGTSSTDFGASLPNGIYKVSYVGPAGAVQFSGIASLVGQWQTVGREQRAEIQVTSVRMKFGQMFTVTITNPTGQAVSDLHVYYPGHDYDDPQVFNHAYLAMLRPFSTVRLMGFMGTNLGYNSSNPTPPPHITEWAERPQAAIFGSQSYGQIYEAIPQLANETGKDLWVNIPEYASDDYIHQFARFLRANLDICQIRALRAQQGLDPKFHLLIEYSNETWNGGFYVEHHLLADANANPSRYPATYTPVFGPSWMAGNTDLVKVAEVEADRLANAITIFRGEFAGTNADYYELDTVLSGWELGAAYSDAGLHFLKQTYGSASAYVTYIAPSGYFGPDSSQTSTLPSLFAGMTTAISNIQPAYSDFKRLADSYGVKVAVYEGGQGLGGATNFEITHLAEYDARMVPAYTQMFTMWKQIFGESPFMSFDLNGGEGAPLYDWTNGSGGFSFDPVSGWTRNPWRVWGFWAAVPFMTNDLTSCVQNLPQYADTTTASDAETTINQLENMASPPCPKYAALLQQLGN